MSAKPLVEYDPTYPVEILLGFGAFVKPINHPNPDGLVSNDKMVLTSPVVKYDGEGCFETANTLYIPRKAS